MRYIKVLLLVVFIFVVMMFFVQNHAVFSQKLPLTLDLLVIPRVDTEPIPFYTLLLLFFLVGALCTLLMLILDRIAISARLAKSRMRVRSLEKSLVKAGKAQEAAQHEAIEARTQADEARTQADEARTRADEAEAARAEAEAKTKSLEA